MPTNASLIGGAARSRDVATKVLQLVAQHLALAQLGGESQFAGMQASVDARDQQRLAHTPASPLLRCIGTGSDRYANRAQARGVEHVANGTADAGFIDD